MSAVARGLNGERRAAIFLRDLGYLVASRRHIGGAGDLLCIEVDDEFWPPSPLLVEVKTNGSSPFATFAPQDRANLLSTAEQYGCEPLLMWWPTPSVGPFCIPAEDWPLLTNTQPETEEERDA